MEISQKLLGLLFTLSAAVGAGLGLLYNVIHLFRAIVCATVRDCPGPGKRPQRPASSDRRVPSGTPSQVPHEEQERAPSEGSHAHGRRLAAFLLFWPDLAFGLACVLSLILLLYFTNDGQFRLLAVLGMSCGGFVWYHLLGKHLMRLSSAAVRLFFRLTRKLLHLLAVPAAWLFRLLDRRIGAPLRARAARKREKAEIRRTDAWLEARVKAASEGFGLSDPPGRTNG